MTQFATKYNYKNFTITEYVATHAFSCSVISILTNDNRYRYVKIANEISSKSLVKFSVPQGSVFGSILSIIII